MSGIEPSNQQPITPVTSTQGLSELLIEIEPALPRDRITYEQMSKGGETHGKGKLLGFLGDKDQQGYRIAVYLRSDTNKHIVLAPNGTTPETIKVGEQTISGQTLENGFNSGTIKIKIARSALPGQALSVTDPFVSSSTKMELPPSPLETKIADASQIKQSGHKRTLEQIRGETLIGFFGNSPEGDNRGIAILKSSWGEYKILTPAGKTPEQVIVRGQSMTGKELEKKLTSGEIVIDPLENGSYQLFAGFGLEGKKWNGTFVNGSIVLSRIHQDLKLPENVDVGIPVDSVSKQAIKDQNGNFKIEIGGLEQPVSVAIKNGKFVLQDPNMETISQKLTEKQQRIIQLINDTKVKEPNLEPVRAYHNRTGTLVVSHDPESQSRYRAYFAGPNEEILKPVSTDPFVGRGSGESLNGSGILLDNLRASPVNHLNGLPFMTR